ncbi:MAG TPA: XTP/dITP diphosphatase [Clostridiaceae bacterium]|nr:XTP/dITP diphosphatase [Clostridiaceae bacterium]
MKRFIVATKNKGKLEEIKEILRDFPYEVISMEEAGITIDIEESGTTFEENAMIKAEAIFQATGEMVMADDSGLEVDYLDGAPGIYSSRFAGEGATDEEKNKKLLKLLEGVPFEKRSARFVCVIAVIFTDGQRFTVKGTCDGYIVFEPIGDNGFGYDPLFYVPEYKMTTAQMEPELKNSISHRGRALAKMVEELKLRQQSN